MAMVAGIAVLLVVASLGILTLASSSGPGPVPTGGVAINSSTAGGLSTSQLGPGPWQLFLAEGFDPWNATTVTNDPSSGIPLNCTLTSTPAVEPPTIVYPAYRGDLSNGTAVIWILAYVQPTSHTTGIALIINGYLEITERLSGPDCDPFASVNYTAIPAAAIGSTSAAQAIDEAGGAQFLAQHRDGVSLTMFLNDFLEVVGSSSARSPDVPPWDFDYDPCGGNPFSSTFTPGPSNATGFSGTVYAMNGTVEQASEYPGACGLTPPPAAEVFPFMPGCVLLVQGSGPGGTIAGQGCQSGDYCYSLTVAQPYENDTPSDFDLGVTEGNGTTVGTVAGYAVLDPSGAVLVYSNGPRETSWTAAAGSPATPLVNGDSLWVAMGPSYPAGISYTLNAQGLGPFADDISSTVLS